MRAEKATLAQVLSEVQRQTGAEIAIPADAEHEQVVANVGPAPAKEVLAALLSGSRYNFILLGNDAESGSLLRAILSPKSGELTPEPYVPAQPPQAAISATIEPTIGPQPNPVVVPLPDTPPDLPPYGRGNAWADQGQLPPKSQQSLGDLNKESK